ncbi:putative DNA binding domain-containing protein [Arthrobacter sp. ISL-48]|uniref:ATP-binding protein n=1 Tax=Arthrobacter sp. ISL-48 TaxID=2819110 RepID=UPI001BE72146|nr:ATP-binding protein [Arthrobacter sp. ISL-48]MBT2533919.1 putative DNA binding domain-containing protein [Arthrobacter sp. ISL-48]
MPRELVDHALKALLGERARKLLLMKEDQWFERKSYRVDPKDVAKGLIAFANAEGGVLVVGLSDGAVEQSSQYEAKVNALRRVPVELVDLPIRHKVSEIAVLDSILSTQHLLVFTVEPGERVHCSRSGDTYLRVGDSSIKLSFDQERELNYDRGMARFEAEPARDVTIEDLDHGGLAELRDALGADTDESVLNARNLLTRDRTPTNAAVLLFGQDPQKSFSQAYVRVIKYVGKERGTGSSLAIEAGKDIRLGGGIPKVIEQAQHLVEEWMPKRTALLPSGRFGDVSILPRDVWLEGLVNAVVHRSYSQIGDHVRFEIFADRVEISSPGRFPGLVDLNNPLNISRYSRNPLIARVCSDLGITRELGEGIRRIFAEMADAGLAEPQYRQRSESVELILRAVARIPSEVVARLPKRSLETLQFLEQAEQALGTGEIADAMQQSRPTTLRQLRALQEQRLVLWSGNSQRDPRASWAAIR